MDDKVIDELDTYPLEMGTKIFLDNIVKRYGIDRVNKVLEPQGYQLRTGQGEG